MKWNVYNDDDFMKQRVSTLQTDSDSTYHSVQVFSEIKENPIAMRKRTQHTVKVCGGAYGETVWEQVMPWGTELRAAREQAEKIALKFNTSGLTSFRLEAEAPAKQKRKRKGCPVIFANPENSVTTVFPRTKSDVV